MDANFVIGLGQVSNLSVTQRRTATDMVDLHFYTADQVRRGYSLTIGAARTLWYHLTEILYPNAARQLIPRAATAVVHPQGPLTVAFTAKVELVAEPRRLEITAMSSVQGWKMDISIEEGYELWAYLSERCAPLATRDSS